MTSSSAGELLIKMSTAVLICGVVLSSVTFSGLVTGAQAMKSSFEQPGEDAVVVGNLSSHFSKVLAISRCPRGCRRRAAIEETHESGKNLNLLGRSSGSASELVVDTSSSSSLQLGEDDVDLIGEKENKEVASPAVLHDEKEFKEDVEEKGGKNYAQLGGTTEDQGHEGDEANPNAGARRDKKGQEDHVLLGRAETFYREWKAGAEKFRRSLNDIGFFDELGSSNKNTFYDKMSSWEERLRGLLDRSSPLGECFLVSKNRRLRASKDDYYFEQAQRDFQASIAATKKVVEEVFEKYYSIDNDEDRPAPAEHQQEGSLFGVGQLARLQGLASRPELNGKRVRIKQVLANGEKFGVEVLGVAALGGGDQQVQVQEETRGLKTQSGVLRVVHSSEQTTPGVVGVRSSSFKKEMPMKGFLLRGEQSSKNIITESVVVKREKLQTIERSALQEEANARKKKKLLLEMWQKSIPSAFSVYVPETVFREIFFQSMRTLFMETEPGNSVDGCVLQKFRRAQRISDLLLKSHDEVEQKDQEEDDEHTSDPTIMMLSGGEGAGVRLLHDDVTLQTHEEFAVLVSAFILKSLALLGQQKVAPEFLLDRFLPRTETVTRCNEFEDKSPSPVVDRFMWRSVWLREANAAKEEKFAGNETVPTAGFNLTADTTGAADTTGDDGQFEENSALLDVAMETSLKYTRNFQSFSLHPAGAQYVANHFLRNQAGQSHFPPPRVKVILVAPGPKNAPKKSSSSTSMVVERAQEDSDFRSSKVAKHFFPISMFSDPQNMHANWMLTEREVISKAPFVEYSLARDSVLRFSMRKLYATFRKDPSMAERDREEKRQESVERHDDDDDDDDVNGPLGWGGMVERHGREFGSLSDIMETLDSIRTYSECNVEWLLETAFPRVAALEFTPNEGDPFYFFRYIREQVMQIRDWMQTRSGQEIDLKDALEIWNSFVLYEEFEIKYLTDGRDLEVAFVWIQDVESEFFEEEEERNEV
ncbi:unnamed protein product [Amoebophrya sp. A25]|nr:unnamed protein product [Amoebophrya sp. A25]|eukprot:GSA25T00010665001.1